jgi:hypothetical protein
MSQREHAFDDPELPIEKKVDAILEVMTFEEKVPNSWMTIVKA